MTLQELNKQLDTALRAYIKKRDHILTGALYNSVMFDCTSTNGDLKIKFSANYYIKFLEHGEFVSDFFNLQSTNDILTTYVAEMIEDML